MSSVLQCKVLHFLVSLNFSLKNVPSCEHKQSKLVDQIRCELVDLTCYTCHGFCVKMNNLWLLQQNKMYLSFLPCQSVSIILNQTIVFKFSWLLFNSSPILRSTLPISLLMRLLVLLIWCSADSWVDSFLMLRSLFSCRRKLFLLLLFRLTKVTPMSSMHSWNKIIII